MAIDIGTRLGAYELLGPLGSGGMGEVYKARDTRLGRIVAIKVLSDNSLGQTDARARFQREALAIASLNHPHICTLYDIGHEHGVDFIIMEYVEGETLSSRLTRGPLPIPEALSHARDIARAVDAAHRRGVIHRDLKPANVMLTAAGAKLLDFGLAKLHRAERARDGEMSTQSDDISRDGAVVGTLRYMAPELFKGAEADARSDVFSLGAVMYEMITGQAPFHGSNNARIIAAVLTEEPKPITELRPEAPATLDWIVRTSLAKDPDERWQGARELLRQLNLLDQGHLSPATPTPVRRPQSGRARNRTLVIGALTAVAAIAGIAVALIGWPESSRAVVPAAAADEPAPHVVVLPCRPIGDAPTTDRAQCDGLASVLTAALSRLTTRYSLQVSPASEVHSRRIESAQQARQELGASLALEGSLLRLGDELRLTYALIDTNGPRQVDAITLSAGSSDPFRLQEDLVKWAAGALQLALDDSEQLTGSRGTSSGDAYAFALQGHGYLLDYHRPGSIDAAIELFRKAQSADPRYAVAYAGLGEAMWRKYEVTKSGALVEDARTACREALNLDPALASAYVCAGLIASGTGEAEQAIVFLERALQIDPANDAGYRLLARAQEQLGRTEAALATYTRAVQLRPRYWATHVWLAAFHRSRSNYAEAAREYERAVELAPDNAPARGILAGLYTFLGRYDEAVAECQRSLAMSPSPITYGALGMTYYRMRRFDEAVAALEKARSLLDDFRTAGNLARAQQWAGRKDHARELFAQAIRLGEQELAINPRNDEVLVALADYHARLGHRAEALAHLDRARVANPHFMFFAAMVHNQLGDLPEARSWLSKASAAGLPPAEITGWIDVDNLRK